MPVRYLTNCGYEQTLSGSGPVKTTTINYDRRAAMPADRHTNDIDAIRKLDLEWGEAACKKNLESVLAFYAADGSLVWPNVPAEHGISAIRAAWVELLKTPGLSLRFTPERIEVATDGDLAIDFGKVDFGHDTETGHILETAKYVVIWKKESGAWKVLYDCYNMNTAKD